MRKRSSHQARFTVEGLERRLALSSMSAGSGPAQEVRHHHHDGGDINARWEPKPIGHGSTRPTVPSGPVRWQGDGMGHDGGDHDRGDHGRGDHDR